MFYDPGVGTLERTNAWKKWRQDLSAIFGLATGYGLDDNILNSYEFIVDNYADGDDIYLFGFSRGAYTVRALAGLIHAVGLIAKPQRNLGGFGLTAYKQFSSDFVDQAGAARPQAVLRRRRRMPPRRRKTSRRSLRGSSA